MSLFVHKSVDMLARMIDFQLLHADEALIVVDKPAGLLAVPGRGDAGRDCLSARVQQMHADALIVHRLDQATSGLMLFALGVNMQRALSMAFESRSVHKRYVAIVAGCIHGDEGEINAPLAADWPNRPRQQVNVERGKASLTRWRVLERGDNWTRLDLEPVTGRTHQLRVHLMSIGHPIIGDRLYDAPLDDAQRLMLHAARLELPHPLHQRACLFESAVPF